MSKNPVIDYYHTLESRLGYRHLKGVRHFGYYPKGQEHLPMFEAQMLLNDQLALRLSLPKGARVLDAGCGEGNVAIYLAQKHGLHVEGIDLLPESIEYARVNAKKAGVTDQTHFQLGSYQQLPFPDNTFDAVYTVETFVHSPNYHQGLTEFCRVLKPGGRLVLFEYTIKPEGDLTANERGPMKRIKFINEVAYMPAFNEFTFDSMPAKLEAAGFTDAKSEDISERMWPLLKRFHDAARPAYLFSRIFGFQRHVINSMSAVELYRHRQLFHYEITTGVKPNKK